VGQYGSTRTAHAQNLRIRRSRERPPPVKVTLSCPTCGGEHRAEDHGLQNRAVLDAMSPEGLRHLRAQVVEELVSAVRGGAAPEHLAGVVVVLDALDRRLGVDD
jgi:hypothetical protein